MSAKYDLCLSTNACFFLLASTQSLAWQDHWAHPHLSALFTMLLGQSTPGCPISGGIVPIRITSSTVLRKYWILALPGLAHAARLRPALQLVHPAAAIPRPAYSTARHHCFLQLACALLQLSAGSSQQRDRCPAVAGTVRCPGGREPNAPKLHLHEHMGRAVQGIWLVGACLTGCLATCASCAPPLVHACCVNHNVCKLSNLLFTRRC